MIREFCSYDAAKEAAESGEEIWVRDTRFQPAWQILTKAEADEYIAKTPFKTYIHWETVE